MRATCSPKLSPMLAAVDHVAVNHEAPSVQTPAQGGAGVIGEVGAYNQAKGDLAVSPFTASSTRLAAAMRAPWFA